MDWFDKLIIIQQLKGKSNKVAIYSITTNSHKQHYHNTKNPF